MRPKFILTILFITLAFFLIMLISPEMWHRKAIGRAVVRRIQNPTPDNILALKMEQAKAKHNQHVVCWLTVLNVVVIVIYGGLHERKRTN